MSGTSYKDALNTALEEAGVSSEEELFDQKIFELQQRIVTSQYWANTEESYYKDYINNNYVYHVSQILVKVNTAGNKDYFDVELGKAEAEKLYKVTKGLIDGQSFYELAGRYSDDESKDNFGDMGLITLNDTTIPNEFKYALASYSIYFEDAELDYPEYFDEVYGDGFEVIPEEYVDVLGEKYDEDSGIYHITSTSGTVSLYSRVQAKNILFNNLYNSRTFRLLQTDTSTTNVKEITNPKLPLIHEAGFETSVDAVNVVTNESNVPILVVRSDKGIHFISITKSAFAGESELMKYYSKEIDDTDAYRTYVEKGVDSASRNERLNQLEAFANDYATMKISGNSDFAGNEDFLKYDRFKYYLDGKHNGVKFEIKDKKVEKLILDYIDAQKAYVTKKIENVFNSGYDKLANSEEEYANTSNVLKNIPILNCLNNKGCTYTHETGFKTYGGVGS